MHLVESVQVFHRGGPSHVEQVLSSAQVAGSWTLPPSDVGQGVFHHDTLALFLPSFLRRLRISEAL